MIFTVSATHKVVNSVGCLKCDFHFLFSLKFCCVNMQHNAFMGFSGTRKAKWISPLLLSQISTSAFMKRE